MFKFFQKIQTGITILVCHEHKRIRYGIFNWNDRRNDIDYIIISKQPDISGLYHIEISDCDMCDSEMQLSLKPKSEFWE